MVSISVLQTDLGKSHPKAIEYEVLTPLNIYDSSELKALATQAIVHRHLRFQTAAISPPLSDLKALPIVLCEDQYPGWLAIQDLEAIRLTSDHYCPRVVEAEMVQARMAGVIAFAQKAMAIPNEYLWGGTIGPNLDCSGLVQRAFESQDIWLPRDAYQQEAFAEPLKNPGNSPKDLLSVLKVGDLLFFGSPKKATHVAIYIGDGSYIHSSGRDQGHNRIGIDSLDTRSHPVSQTYYQQVRGAGRVTHSFIPPLDFHQQSHQKKI